MCVIVVVIVIVYTHYYYHHTHSPAVVVVGPLIKLAHCSGSGSGGVYVCVCVSVCCYSSLVCMCCIGTLIFFILNSLHHEVVGIFLPVSSNLRKPIQHTHLYIHMHIYIPHYTTHVPIQFWFYCII